MSVYARLGGTMWRSVGQLRQCRHGATWQHISSREVSVLERSGRELEADAMYADGASKGLLPRCVHGMLDLHGLDRYTAQTAVRHALVSICGGSAAEMSVRSSRTGTFAACTSSHSRSLPPRAPTTAFSLAGLTTVRKGLTICTGRPAS